VTIVHRARTTVTPARQATTPTLTQVPVPQALARRPPTPTRRHPTRRHRLHITRHRLPRILRLHLTTPHRLRQATTAVVHIALRPVLTIHPNHLLMYHLLIPTLSLLVWATLTASSLNLAP
jgi:hypothetical protein